MQIRIQIEADDYSCDELFDNYDDAEDYLANCEMNHEDEDGDDDDCNDYDEDAEDYVETRKKFSYSTVGYGDESIETIIDEFSEQGYEVIYKGKTGLTFEKIKEENV